MSDTQERYVRGTAELTVDAGGLEATLRFRKHDDGEDYTGSDLVSLLQRKGITNGFEPDQAEQWIAKIDQSPESSVEVPVARGTEPEAPQAEQAQFDDKPIPEELRERAETIVANAPDPEITVEKTQTVEREKIVEKRSKLPFVKPKRERVTVQEKQRVPERVYIDPTVEWTGFAKAGDRIAELTPRQPGVAGQNVYGNAVQPKRLADPHFYAGPGVERHKSELFAARTGFIRRGVNWADIVPFEQHEWTVTLSKDKATCLLDFRPGSAEAHLPRASEVRERATELGYEADLLIPDEEIEQLLTEAARDGRSLEQVPITHSRDASFDIFVTEDRLRAVLNVSKGSGRGAPLRLKELGRAIKQSGLRGMDLKQIQHDIMSFYHSTQQHLTGYVLAEGKAPTEGHPKEIEWSARFLSDEEAAELGDERPEEEGFPGHAVTGVARVSQDQRVALLAPGTAGEPGVDVYGSSIAPGEPAEPCLELVSGLRQEKNFIIAEQTGILELAHVDDCSYVRVRPHREADIQVEISPDRRQAFLTIEPPRGTDTEITETQVHEALQREGVVHGVDEPAVRDAVARVGAGETVTQAAVAKATEPIHGSGPRVKFRVRLASGTPFTRREDGSVDHKEKDLLTTVEKGTEIAQILPPEREPAHGTDVTGKTIPAESHQGDAVSLGDNVRSERDGHVTHVYAAASGELLWQRGTIDVTPTHVVKGPVGVPTGNITFPGSVHVRGAVQSGYYIMAGGDIQVAEGAEGALLSASGDIVVKQGVKGAGKAVLRSKQNIGSAFAERAMLLSVGDIALQKSCLHCTVKSNGRLNMRGKSATLIGGEVRTRRGVEVVNLGSPSSTKTTVSFGQDYLIADQIEKEERDIEKTKQRVNEIDLSMREGQDAHDTARLDELRAEKKRLLKQMEKRSLRLFTLREKFEQHYESDVTIKGTVYPGVVLESHGRRLEITRPKSAVRFSFNQETGHLDEEPLAQQTRHTRSSQ
jgi:hypothetical protein